jgi:hypothetical protein
MRSTEVVLPSNEFFPDPYQPTLASARLLANRVAFYIGVNEDAFEIHLYAEGEEAWKEAVPFWSGEKRDANGLFFYSRTAPDLRLGYITINSRIH